MKTIASVRRDILKCVPRKCNHCTALYIQCIDITSAPPFVVSVVTVGEVVWC